MNKMNKTDSEFNTPERRKTYTAIANDMTMNNDTYGKQSVEDFVKHTSENIRNGVGEKQRLAREVAGDFTSNFILKCLKQEIENHPAISYMEFVDIFNDEILDEGNAKEFNNQLLTGADSFDENEWVPDSASPVDGESHVFQMYVRDTTGGKPKLAENAFQFKKPISIRQQQWLPYFNSGNLGTFVSMVIETVQKTYRIYKYNMICNLIVAMTPKRVIAGKAPNLFEALYKEILPELENMKYLSSDYNYSADSKYLATTNPSDLIMVMSTKTKSALTGGVQSQLFNRGLISPENFISPNNIVSLGKKIWIGTSKDLITVSNEFYQKDTDIYVLNPRAIRFIEQVNTQESQAYASNLTLQIYLHVWGGVTILPWGQCFKYSNPNLNVVPSEESTPGVYSSETKEDALKVAGLTIDSLNEQIETLTKQVDTLTTQLRDKEVAEVEKVINDNDTKK